MSSHPNRGWRGRWAVDTEKREAHHAQSGLIVTFRRGADPGDGQIDPQLLRNVYAALLEAHGEDRARRSIARLQREASEIYRERAGQHAPQPGPGSRSPPKG